jgi:hypothetical protein
MSASPLPRAAKAVRWDAMAARRSNTLCTSVALRTRTADIADHHPIGERGAGATRSWGNDGSEARGRSRLRMIPVMDCAAAIAASEAAATSVQRGPTGVTMTPAAPVPTPFAATLIALTPASTRPCAASGVLSRASAVSMTVVTAMLAPPTAQATPFAATFGTSAGRSRAAQRQRLARTNPPGRSRPVRIWAIPRDPASMPAPQQATMTPYMAVPCPMTVVTRKISSTSAIVTAADEQDLGHEPAAEHRIVPDVPQTGDADPPGAVLARLAARPAVEPATGHQQGLYEERHPVDDQREPDAETLCEQAAEGRAGQ